MTKTHGRAGAGEGQAAGSPARRDATPAPGQRDRERSSRRWQRPIVFAVLAAVVAVDQTAKWWAWRHVPGVRINPGGDFLTGHTVGRWYTEPVPGALLDLLGFALVGIAVMVLARRARPAAITVCGSLMIGGWGSNLLDRLGMHYLTAPGSIRGAVDFISVGGNSYNVADFCIIGATPLFLFAVAFLACRPGGRAAARAAAPAAGNSGRIRAPIAALAAAGVIMTVALGAAHQGKLIRPSHAGHRVSCCRYADGGRR